jgi:hypothetical protein
MTTVLELEGVHVIAHDFVCFGRALKNQYDSNQKSFLLRKNNFIFLSISNPSILTKVSCMKLCRNFDSS